MPAHACQYIPHQNWRVEFCPTCLNVRGGAESFEGFKRDYFERRFDDRVPVLIGGLNA